MRLAVDTGGTFTDLLVEDDAQVLHMFKASTTPADPMCGVMDALALASTHFGMSLQGLLARCSMFIYGTTHALNAVVTGNTARTAFLTSAGHPDVLTLREGGRADAFDFTVASPAPYVPRALTWEIPGRMLADGQEHAPFDDAVVLRIVDQMRDRQVEAVAVCLLWSIVNPAHERRLGALLADHLPGVPYTLSHELNPALREYRRASSTCIDASLKPMMTAYLETLSRRLTDNGFTGRTLVVTSQGSVMDSADVARAPIYLINSGPSMAPVSGRHFALADEGTDTVIVADTGGTTYDVSLVRKGEIPWTRDSWIGLPFRGHLSGFASVDVVSVGAGGGSIAWVDHGGMLHVGPQSAGSQPGPACYGRGGTLPTVTDASVVLGHLDPDFFLGGTMQLDREAARRAIQDHVAGPLSLGMEQAASAILQLATEAMVQAILDTSVAQGVDPAGAVLIGGGGAAGLNSVLIARRLGSRRLLIPQVGAALSAAGALLSDLSARFQSMVYARSGDFAYDKVNAALADLEARCRAFIARQGDAVSAPTLTFWAEARYVEQAWEVQVVLPSPRIDGPEALAAVLEAFHAAHETLFAVRDEGSEVEIVGWGATVACPVTGASRQVLPSGAPASEGRSDARDAIGSVASGALGASGAEGAGGARPVGAGRTRKAWFDALGHVDAEVHRFETLSPTHIVHGPALIESSFTTVVLHPGASAQRRPSGSLAITPGSA